MLKKLAEQLAYGYEQEKLKQAHAQQMGGLSLVAGALPVCAMGGLKYALPMLGFGLYQLYKSHKNENDAYAAAKFHHRLNPSYVPRMDYSRPRPW